LFCKKSNNVFNVKAADLNELVHGGQKHQAFPFKKVSLLMTILSKCWGLNQMKLLLFFICSIFSNL
jgi:hypothetical protein